MVSTVSGGSIVGALFALLVKRELERSDRPTRRDYLELVDELTRRTRAGIRKNLRARLFLDPLALLRTATPSYSLGRRMARLYERHFFAPVVRELDGLSPEDPPWIRRLEGGRRPATGPRRVVAALRRWLAGGCRACRRRLRPGRIALSDIRIRPGGRPIRGGIGRHNREQLRKLDNGEPGAVVPRLVLNATALNSGARFWLSAVEAGDRRLGHVRPDEAGELLDRKRLLEGRIAELASADGGAAETTLEGLFHGLRDPAAGGRPAVRIRGSRSPLRTVALARWWRDGGPADVPEGWEAFAGHLPALAPGLARADMGLLREAKLPAWYLRVGSGSGGGAVGAAPGGRRRREHWRRLLATLEEIDPRLRRSSVARFESDPDPGRRRERSDLLLDFVLEMYWIRTAERVSFRVERDWRRLTLGRAVGASAAFPPVFAPVAVAGLYDDDHVSRLTLTDGGVYDNMGIVALLEAGCEYVIASDAGRRLRRRRRGPAGRLSGGLRSLDVLQTAVAGFQRGQMRERRRVSRSISDVLDLPPSSERVERDLRFFLARRRLSGLAYFHIGSPPERPELRAGAGPVGAEAPRPAPHLGLDTDLLAGVRTDLDAFGEVETAALIDRGYETADQYVRSFLADSLGTPEWESEERRPRVPEPLPSRERTHRVLRAGSSRFLRPVRLLRLAVPTAFRSAAVVLGTVLAAAAGLGLQRLGWTGGDVVDLTARAALLVAAGSASLLLGALLLGILGLASGRLYRWMTRVPAPLTGPRDGGGGAEAEAGQEAADGPVGS